MGLKIRFAFPALPDMTENLLWYHGRYSLCREQTVISCDRCAITE